MPKIPTSGRKLTILPLAAATYFMVSGGPYGIEELVQDSGYKLALIILFLTPLVWSLPTGLMVGELPAALPAGKQALQSEPLLGRTSAPYKRSARKNEGRRK